ncbi:hypothetical protein M758_1G001700 [Ceratodon purpureus]|uniref:Carbohydrate kinase PfkB domain-containing protein n=1 Tax=Ceratodon purpureus TaxID=3225 RepID=A0A8T0J241_CERPU|nr:hypothetical protein KC19_1G003400 [Ceratodon purpureus]KAG0628114.1 hypothetical protein M758_1G001700 [Ceratodon purpureus]
MATGLLGPRFQVVEAGCKSMDLGVIGSRLIGGYPLNAHSSLSRGRFCRIPVLRVPFPRREVLVSAIKGKSEPGTVNASKGKASTSTTKRVSRKKKVVEEDEDSVDEDVEEYDWPPLVCCFGEAHYEFIPSVRPYERQMDEDIYSSWKGLQWSPPEFARAPGSSPSNVAVALARLGGKVVFMGKVGNDVFGHELLLTLNTNGVQTRGVKIADRYGTGVSLMRLTHGNGAGIQMTCETPSVEATLKPEEVDLDILKEARMFQFTSISLMYDPLRSTLMSSIDAARKGGSEIFFDVNLPLPYWKSRETTWNTIQKAWMKSTMIEVTKQELEFLLGEELYEKKRLRQSVYFSKSVEEMKQLTSGREEYHYMPEELTQLWHKNLRILFVTDGTWRIHYYTPTFHGSVAGTEDVLVTPFSCDRTGSGDAVIAAIIRKLTTQPQLLLDQDKLEKALRFSICAGIVSQWTVGAIRGFPTESAAQNLTEQVYPPSMVLYTI